MKIKTIPEQTRCILKGCEFTRKGNLIMIDRNKFMRWFNWMFR